MEVSPAFDLSTTLGLVAVVALVLANGFFVATEFAIVAVRKSRLEQLAREGKANARAAQEVVGHLDTSIAACQLGITMASLALGWIGEPAFAHLVQGALQALVGVSHPLAEHGVAVGISFALITALHIVAGELAPKGLALQKAEGTALWVARPLQLFEFAFRWPIRLLNGIGNSVLRLFGLQPASGHEMVHSVEELRVLVRATQQAGGVEESEARIASRAFSFADLTAGALMTPRTEVDGVPAVATWPDVLAAIGRTHHSRLPVYQGSLDEIVGVLYVQDVARALAHGAGSHGEQGEGAGTDAGNVGPDRPAGDLRALLRPVVAVPESKPADDLLEEMRASGRYFAVVLDEYGGTAGIVTLEDLIEALVGPMKQEWADAQSAGSDQPREQEAPLVVRDADASLVVDGLLRLEEWEEATGLRLDAADHAAVETLGGLVMARLGRVPAVGDEVEIGGRTVRVEAMDGLRAALMRVAPAANSSPGVDEAAGG